VALLTHGIIFSRLSALNEAEIQHEVQQIIS